MARLAYVHGRIHAAGGDLDAARASFLGGLRQLDGLPMPYARARARARVKFVLPRDARQRRSLGGGRPEPRAAQGRQRHGWQPLDGGCPAGCRGTHHAAAQVAELTEQEKAVADLVAAGLSNKEAAAELYVSVKTVQYDLTRIYAKFHLTSRSGLAAVYPGGREQGGVDGGIAGTVGGSKGRNQALPQ